MTNPRTATRLLAVPLLLATVACGDGTDVELGDLSQAEAASLLAALSSVWFPSPSAPQGAPAGPALAPETTVRQDTTDTVVACAGGGNVSILSIDSMSVTVDFRLNPSPDTTYASNSEYGGSAVSTTTYAGCQAPDGQGGTWTFDSSSGLSFSYDIEGEFDSYTLTGGQTVSSSSLDWSGLWAGSLTWSNDGRSGTCTISLTSTSSSSNNSGQVSTNFSQQGQICGLDISSGS